MFGHPAFADQPCDVIDVDPAPDAFLLARRVALEIALVVETFADAIDPTPAKHHVDGLLRSDRFEPRIHFVDLDPDLVFLEVVFAEPLIETLRVLERADFIGIDFGGCHQQTLKAITPTVRCREPSSTIRTSDTKLRFSREILTAKDSTQFCRDSNQCLLPRLYHLVVRILSYRQVRGEAAHLIAKLQAGICRFNSRSAAKNKNNRQQKN